MAYIQQTESSTIWSPPESNQITTRPTVTQVVVELEKPQEQALDLVSRLKKTWIGKVYARHLKQIVPIRRLVIWSWRELYPLYANSIRVLFASKNVKRWYPLINLANYALAHNIPTITLLKTVCVTTPQPKVFPSEDQAYLSPPHANYSFPSVYVAAVSNALVHGGTNLVLTQEAVICHDLYDFDRDFTSEELHGRHQIDTRRSRIRWLRYDEKPAHTPTAAIFVDACAANYAHWLTEVLPRIAAFCANDELKSIPIIINDGLHKNIMESLFLIIEPERKIITIPIGRALQVDLLYITSTAGYVPFEKRDLKFTDHSHGRFSSAALSLIQSQVKNLATDDSKVKYPKKIYIRRKVGARRVINANEVEDILIRRGYAIVEPEKMSFRNQILMFSNANHIIAPSGAALANIVFMNSSAKILILIGKIKNTSYWYWQNIACCVQSSICYALCDIANKADGIHANMMVNLQDIIKFDEMR